MGVIGTRLPLADPPDPDRPFRPVNGSCVVAGIGIAELSVRMAIIRRKHALGISSANDPGRSFHFVHQSKQARDFTDIVRLVEAWARLTPELRQLVKPPAG